MMKTRNDGVSLHAFNVYLLSPLLYSRLPIYSSEQIDAIPPPVAFVGLHQVTRNTVGSFS